MAKASDYLIALDDGHGQETAGKRTPLFPDGTFMKENDFNRAVVEKMNGSLRRCGFRVLLAAPEDTDVALKLRTDRANAAKADFYLSVHANAMGSTWQTGAHGIETYYYPGANDAKQAAQILQSHLIQASGLYNRGVKTADFHVLRETIMTAVLAECGFMDYLEEAKLLLSEDYRLKAAEALTEGMCEYFGVPYIPAAPVMGEPVCSAEQMDRYVRQVNPNAPKLAELFLQIGKRYGVRGDLAFAQSILETGFFKFGGDVKPEQNNFGGLGATGGVPGDSFATPEEGITAQIQHLYAYASTEPLPAGEPLADPRFHLVTRGVAPNIEDLAGRWAVPGYDSSKYPSLQDAFLAGDTYGQNIAQIALEMSKTELPQSPFSDVPVTHWAFSYIAEADQLGLLTGYDNGEFRPDQPASRAELAAAIMRLYHLLSE